jgi:hypothetical protein
VYGILRIALASTMTTDMNKVHDDKGPDDLVTKTVTFHVDEGRKTSYDFDRLPISSQETSYSQISDFLARPILAGTFTWAATAVQGVDLFHIYPSDIIIANPMYSNKLTGFKFMRATVNVKVEIQPTPFQYGAFYLAWLPFQKAIAADRVKMHDKLFSFSQLPGVMYTTEDNSIELSFPFVGPQDAWDKTSNGWDFGSIKAKIYCQLFSGANNPNLTVNVYMWFTNVELSGLVPQSSSKVVTRRNPKRMIPVEREANNGQGTITSVLMKATELADTMSGIPLFRTVSEPAAWVLGSLSKVTSALGWSKPDVGSGGKNRFVTNLSDAYATNHSGNDAGVYLSANPTSYITPHRMLSPRVEDEMSIDFIKQQWSFLGTFSFGSQDTQGAEIYSQIVCPRFFASGINYATLTGTTTVYDMTPLAWLGYTFNSWRGPIRFRFMMLKTGFHSGQLQVSFSPSGSTSFTNDQFLPRDIFDIQKGDSFCLDVPYVLPLPFIDTGNNSGTISMKVVNPLRAPDTVNQSIVIMVFVRGLPDTHFAKPDVVPPLPCWQPQGHDLEEEGDICSGQIVGNGQSQSPSSLVHQYTVGQKIDSLLQLCKVFIPVVAYNNNIFPLAPTSTQFAYFDPHTMGFCAITGTGPYGVSTSAIGGDYLSRFAGLYLFHRGGVKIKIKTMDRARITTFLLPFNSSNSPDWRVDSRSSFGNGQIRTKITSDENTSLISVIPQYSQYYGYPKQKFRDGGNVGEPYYGQTILGIASNNGWAWDEYNSKTIHRAAAEDFSFHFFLGIPSCVVNIN